MHKGKVLHLGPIQKKILLLIGTGVALGLCGSPKQYFRIINACRSDWKHISNDQLRRSIKSLKKSGYIRYAQSKDGTTMVCLSEKGKGRTQSLRLEQTVITTPKQWDGKWHVIAFDIPCKRNGARNALRFQLRRLGFTEIQKSVFVHPFPCRELIDDIVSYYRISSYVTYMRIDEIDRSRFLKKHFGL